MNDLEDWYRELEAKAAEYEKCSKCGAEPGTSRLPLNAHGHGGSGTSR